jgi:hypothetical protein
MIQAVAWTEGHFVLSMRGIFGESFDRRCISADKQKWKRPKKPLAVRACKGFFAPLRMTDLRNLRGLFHLPEIKYAGL